MSLPDPEFVRRINDKDPSAIQELPERYYQLIWQTAFRWLVRNNMPHDKARIEADDVVGDVWVALVKGGMRTIHTSFDGFLVRMTRNIAVSRFRNRLRVEKRETQSVDEVHYRIPDNQPGPDIKAELSDELRARLARLSREDQRLVEMWAEGSSYEDIARELELSLSTVRMRIHRVLGRLRGED